MFKNFVIVGGVALLLLAVAWLDRPAPAPEPSHTPPVVELANGVEVPDLSGRSEDEAGKVVGKEGLVVGNIFRWPTDVEAQNGRVTLQDPEPGKKVPKGSSVHIVYGTWTGAKPHQRPTS